MQQCLRTKSSPKDRLLLRSVADVFLQRAYRLRHFLIIHVSHQPARFLQISLMQPHITVSKNLQQGLKLHNAVKLSSLSFSVVS